MYAYNLNYFKHLKSDSFMHIFVLLYPLIFSRFYLTPQIKRHTFLSAAVYLFFNPVLHIIHKENDSLLTICFYSICIPHSKAHTIYDCIFKLRKINKLS